MSANEVLKVLSQFCINSTGNSQTWQGNNATYQWTQGKETESGLVNGVVRKLAGIDVSGRQIWVVSGSFKITADGNILRFTGLTKSQQMLITEMSNIKHNKQTV